MSNQQPGRINTSPSVPRLLLNARDAAEALSICERTLWTLTSTGALKSVRIGRAVRYAIDDLQAYIERNRTE